MRYKVIYYSYCSLLVPRNNLHNVFYHFTSDELLITTNQECPHALIVITYK